jgi:ABC-type sulfate/molybdate transport systems ATPase subunit
VTPPLSVRGLSIGAAPITFDLLPGEILAVLGDNGSGKSLLLAHLAGRLRTAPGTVKVAGRELRDSLAEIGVVFQYPALIRNMTVFENIALPFLVHGLDLDGELRAKVLLRMRLLGCGDLGREEVHHLSEGDSRCVALARALSGNARLLIADEPVAALAPAKKALVEELLACLVRTGALAGIVMATQDLDFARRIATRFLLLHPGGHSLIGREEAATDERLIAFSTRSP